MFIAYDDRKMIWGVGDTEREALEDAKQQDLWGDLQGTVAMFDHGVLRPLRVMKCSTKLARDVEDLGGSVLWMPVGDTAHSMVPVWDEEVEDLQKQWS